MRPSPWFWLFCLSLLSCRGCPPPPRTDAGLPASTAVVVNATGAATTVYVSFGADSAIRASDWPFCGDAGGCAFALGPDAGQPIPPTTKLVNATFSFDQPPGCGVSVAEINFNVPQWTEDTADISLVNGWNHDLRIDVSGNSTLGPTRGADAGAGIFGVFPPGCDICVARQSPPCGIAACGRSPNDGGQGCGCQTGEQYDPGVPCQASFNHGAAVAVVLTGR